MTRKEMMEQQAARKQELTEQETAATKIAAIQRGKQDRARVAAMKASAEPEAAAEPAAEPAAL